MADTVWDKIKTGQTKVNLVHGLFITLGVLGGFIINTAYDVAQYFYLPIQNTRDIVVLLEKTQEVTQLGVLLEDLNLEIRNNRTEITETNEELAELRAHLRRLEDGQLKLFLQVERLDERSRRQGN